MAVAKVKKVELIAHNSDKEKIIKALEEASVIQVTTRQEILAPEKVRSHLQERLEEVHEQLSKINFLLGLLHQFYSPPGKIIDSFIPPKVITGKTDYEKILKTIPLSKLYLQMEEVDVQLRQVEISTKEALENLELLEPWQNLDFEPSKLETGSTKIFLGSISASKEAGFLDALQNISLAVPQVVQRKNNLTYMAVFLHKSSMEKFLEQTKAYGFSLAQLPEITGMVADNLKDIANQMNKWQKQKEKLLEEFKQLAAYKDKLVVGRTFLKNKLTKIEIENSLLHTENIFVLEGWIKASDEGKFKNTLSKIIGGYALNFTYPAADEEPPVLLVNHPLLKPFEAVTALYGMPTYKEIDPTPYMAPFFLIFFGLAIGDVIYGAALAIISWLLTKTKRFRENTKTFLRLFIYGGLAAIFFGVITGGWLALDPDTLPPFLQRMILFEPLGQPALFLVITLLLGLVQIYFGLIIKLYEIAKEKSVSKALQAQLPTLLLIPGVALLIAKLLGMPLSNLVNTLAIYLTLTGSLGVIVFSKTEAKNIFVRLGGGLYNLYSMTSLLGDTISYGRIMALGLATFLIGSAINTIILGGVIIKSLLIKILLTVTIFPVVHLLNLAINTIGAFVHPARLQYVEFFSKFFQGGGRHFKPLAIKTDNIMITKN